MTKSSNAKVTTDKASRYLQQMCKHFSHKLDVDFDRESGEIFFPFGKLNMRAGESELTLSVTTEGDLETLAKMEKATADHLIRFMFREEPKIDWTRTD
ncbi:MAG: DUF2218 domain-containing protein [Parasphingorhabdus sp.]